MKKIFLLFLFIAFHFLSKAQDIFVAKGKIEFEKGVNLPKEIESLADDDNDWISSFKKSVPQYESTYFDLYFDGQKNHLQTGKRDRY